MFVRSVGSIDFRWAARFIMLLCLFRSYVCCVFWAFVFVGSVDFRWAFGFVVLERKKAAATQKPL